MHFGAIDLLNKCKSGILSTRRPFFGTQVISLINARAVFLEPADLQLHFIYFRRTCTATTATTTTTTLYYYCTVLLLLLLLLRLLLLLLLPLVSIGTNS